MAQPRQISASEIADAVAQLFLKANHELPDDMVDAIGQACRREGNALARQVLERLEDNLHVARDMQIPICQDTGMAVVFADVGNLVCVCDGTLEEAINAGVARAYRDGALRCSVVRDPLYGRVNTGDNTPAVIHISTHAGDDLRLIAAPKGFGSENMSALRMMTPAATEEDVADFVTEQVRRAGSNPCPPIVVGVGIGGNFESVALLAKRALLRPVGSANPDAAYAALEGRLLRRINRLGIGPQGFGGDTTAFAVHIEQAPTHIAGLPVAVNISCHVTRHAQAVL